MRTFLLAGAAVAALALTTAPSTVHAQGAPQPIASVKVDVQHLATGYRASKINGSTVYNENKDKIGTVDDLIVEPNDRVLFAVLSVGGFLGLGNHLVVVPYNSLNVTNDRIVVPGGTKDMLKALPEFKYAH